MSKGNVFKTLGDWIIIQSMGEIKGQSNLVSLDDINRESYKNHKQWTDKENYIYEVDEELGFKKGDRVLLIPHCKLRRIEEITKLVEEKTGIKTTEKRVIDGKEMKDMDIEIMKFFAVKSEDIISIIK